MSELADSTTRGQSAADHLAAEIETMQEGERLGTKKELCQRLGVANATLNEAIRLLQERGLVTLRPGPKGGIFVAKADPFARLGRTLMRVRDEPDLITGAIEVRESLQGLAALDALRHRTDADVAALRDHVAAIETAINDEAEFARAARQLNEFIAGIGANRVLQTVYQGRARLRGGERARRDSQTGVAGSTAQASARPSTTRRLDHRSRREGMPARNRAGGVEHRLPH